METEHGARRYLAIFDEIVGVLELEGPWLSKQALLNRCALAKHEDHLGKALADLVRTGDVQRHFGDVGLLYGAKGAALPTTTEQPGASKLHSIRQINAANGEAAKVRREAEAEGGESRPRIRNSTPQAARQAVPIGNADVRPKVVEMFREQPLRACRDFQLVLGRSQPAVSALLRSMCEEGLIEKVGTGSAIRFRWIEKPKVPVEQAPPTTLVESALLATAAAEQIESLAANLQPTSADSGVVECSADAMFGFWSNGDFEIRVQGQVMVLKGDVSRQLISFASRLEAAP